MPKLWKKIDPDQAKPEHLRSGDLCFFARDFIPYGGYAASQGNDYVHNFKKPPSKRGTNEWQWKLWAVKRFAEELAGSLKSDAVVAAIPSAKARSDPEFDDRMDTLFVELSKLAPGVTVLKDLFVVDTSFKPAHQGGPRSPDELTQHIRVSDHDFSSLNRVILIDDVITSGGHFVACKTLLLQVAPELEVVGVFWAKTVRD